MPDEISACAALSNDQVVYQKRCREKKEIPAGAYAGTNASLQPALRRM
jgi:hypothetical protein